MAEKALYLYAVTRGPGPALTEVEGHGGRPVHGVQVRHLTAVVSEVDLSEFGEEALRRNLEDLGWLEKVARRHDEVVHAIAQSAAVAPFRLATICLDAAAVRQRLERLYDQFSAALQRVEGRQEWSVKLVSLPQQETVSTLDALPGSGSGAAYLKRKKEINERRAQQESAALDAADRVYDELAGYAVAGRRLEPQDPRLSGHQGSMVLNAAFLVDAAGAVEFTAAAERLAEQLLPDSLSVAGPWPPYSFATLDTP
jgi:hypothetical protein